MVVVVNVSSLSFLSAVYQLFCAVILVICDLDIKGQAAWLAWHGSQLCGRVYTFVITVETLLLMDGSSSSFGCLRELQLYSVFHYT